MFWIQLQAPIADTAFFSAFIGPTRLLNATNKLATELSAGEFQYVLNGGVPTIYVNAGGPPPPYAGDVNFSYDQRGISISSSNYVKVTGFTVTRATRYNIRLSNSTHCLISNCVLTEAKETGLYGNDTAASPDTYNNLLQVTASANLLEGIRLDFGYADTIKLCTASGNGRDGIRVQSGQSEVLLQSAATNNGGDGLASLPGSGGSVGTYITGCVANGNDNGITSGSSAGNSSLAINGNEVNANRARGIFVDETAGVTVSNNQLAGNQSEGIKIGFSSGTVLVEGNLVAESGADGILIDSTPSSVLWDNTSWSNGSQGIQVKNGQGHLVHTNECYGNLSHGIFLRNATSSTVRANRSYNNENPAPPRNGVNGIRIGDNLAGQGGNLIETNVVYGNEDTGIEFHTTQSNICRRNVSYLNHDHGFDNLYSDGTVLVSNVATRNSGSGVSVEAPSTSVVIANCILADNGIDTNRRLNGNQTVGYRGFNLEVHAGAPTATLISHHNIIWSPPYLSQPDDLINWGGAGNSQSELFTSLNQFRAAYPGKETASLDGNPLLADSLGNCRVLAGSAAVDNADVTVPGWSTPDPDGISPWDDPEVTNDPPTGVPPFFGPAVMTGSPA